MASFMPGSTIYHFIYRKGQVKENKDGRICVQFDGSGRIFNKCDQNVKIFESEEKMFDVLSVEGILEKQEIKDFYNNIGSKDSMINTYVTMAINIFEKDEIRYYYLLEDSVKKLLKYNILKDPRIKLVIDNLIKKRKYSICFGISLKSDSIQFLTKTFEEFQKKQKDSKKQTDRLEKLIEQCNQSYQDYNSGVNFKAGIVYIIQQNNNFLSSAIIQHFFDLFAKDDEIKKKLHEFASQIETENDKLKHIIEKRNIEEFIHFTNIHNIESILNYGLVPRKIHDERNIKAIPSDKENRLLSCISLSITFPNYKMLYAKKKQMGDLFILLIIDKSFLYEKVLKRYFPTNASSFMHWDCSSSDWKYSSSCYRGIKAFEKMFIGPERQERKLPDNYTYDPQAEICFEGIIDTKYIKKSVFKQMKIEYGFKKY